MAGKFNIVMVGLILLITSCLSFGKETKYEQNTEEAKEVIEWIIGSTLESKTAISDFYAYENKTGLDPYYYAKFTLNDITFSEVFDSTWLASSSKLYISDNAPNWYIPKIDSTTTSYIKSFNGGSKLLILETDTKECFLFYSTF